jgi:hypothetical protein
LRKNAAEALVFQDEVEIHLFPALARMWAKVGSQPQVPAPGKNDKQVVYGGGRVNGHRDRMGFMFDHDDLLEKKAA